MFLTNNLELKAQEIALLYKYHWKVELFFKWIKQHLKIKSFWGTTPNAVKIQIYSAIIVYCLVSIVGYKLKIDRSSYEILQILNISLFDKTPIKELLRNQDYQDVKELDCIQLKSIIFKWTLMTLIYKLYPETTHDERQGLKSVLVVNDISPNAFMCPNGTILITTGLLSTINSEEELIAALAHEVAHYVLDHSVININKDLQRHKTALFWAGFATVVAASADIYMTAKDEYYTSKIHATG